MRTYFILIFVLVVVLALAAGHYYFWIRLVRDTRLPAPWSRALSTALVVLWLSAPVSFVLLRFVQADWKRYAVWAISVWVGMLFISVIVLAIADSIHLALVVIERLSSGKPADPGRRLWLRRFLGAGAALVSVGLAGWSTRQALRPLSVREITVQLARLPRELDGFTIVQLTDVHFGQTIRRDFAEQIVAKTNRLAPDLIAITGDLVDGAVSELRDIVAPLAGLQAPHGIWFVTGNHEYFSSSDGATGADAWIEELKRLGIRTLRNERVSIGNGAASFDLAGIDDWNAFGPGHRPDLRRALAGRDDARELVLLSHQPRSIHLAAELGVGLQLSGHTHGGQVWPWNYLVRLQQPYVVGLARHFSTYIYVSPGTGFWGPPMRLGTQAEITRIVLRTAA